VVTAAPISEHGPDRLVAEDRPRKRLGHVALEDVQVAAADRGRVDADDRVGRIDDLRVIHGVPAALAGTVVNEGLHRRLLSS
jgi:predicted flap endonuclease-1-like 5' DNA nuclease